MLIDADTAVNVSNAAMFVAALPGMGNTPIYTGRCLQRPMSEADHSAGPVSSRFAVAKFITLQQRMGSSVAWPSNIPPSPGGGPGLVFSRGLLESVRLKLARCEPFAEPFAFGDSVYSGGDSLLTRCLATLGVRCSNERDLHLHDQARCPFAHGCTLVSLFRKNPPWFYHVANRVQTTRLALTKQRPLVGGKQAVLDEVHGLFAPVHEAVTFHHVKPSDRLSHSGPDPRCAVRMRSDPKGQAGWWASTCMPSFCLVGAPRAGMHLILHALERHPEVVMPERRSLQFFTSAWAAPLLRRLGWTWDTPLRVASGGNDAMQLQRAYANRFPTIDPRDFKLTGEASASYMYCAEAALLFARPHFKLMGLIMVLRQPTARSLAELVRRPGQSRMLGHSPSMDVRLDAIAGVRRACGIASVYAACKSCPRMSSNHARAATPSCPAATLQSLPQASDEWRAVWRSWYHLFLPRWLALGERLMVFYSEALQGQDHVATLDAITQFLKLQGGQKLHSQSSPQTISDLPESALPSSVARQLNISESAVIALRELMAESVQRTNSLLQGSGRGGVPRSWFLQGEDPRSDVNLHAI